MSNGHSAIGPSAADRWIPCPASIPMSAKCPKPPTSYAAAEGSVAHKLAEKFLRGELDEMEFMALVGTTIQHDGHAVTIIEEMVEGARLYKETVDADYHEFVLANKPAPIHRLIEQRVDLASVDPDLWGTADYLMFQKGYKLLVYDYKFGSGKMVSPVENAQAGLYGNGAMETLAGNVFDEVQLIIVQPRAAGEKIKRWTADVGWLAMLRQKAANSIKAGRGPNPPIKAGEHCRWCPAQGICPEIHKQVQATVQADFATLAPTEAEVKEGNLRGLPDVKLLTPGQLAQALDWEDPVQAFFGAARARVQQLLEAGESVPGYKLVDGRSNRKWADDSGEAAAAYFAPKFGHRVFAPKTPLSVAQMEKLVGKGKIPEELVIKPEAAKKIAPADDPRPIASTSAQQDFDPLALPGPAPEGYKAEVSNEVYAISGPAPHDGNGSPVDPLSDPLEDPLLLSAAGAKKDAFWP